jgi:hypothetical protein
MGLNDFADRILRPMVLSQLRAGQLDNALSDPDVWEVVQDREMREAMLARLQAIASAKRNDPS